MSVWQFIFYFLYTRNWYTGELELSTPRVILFVAMVVLVLLGFLIVFFLQSPVMYAK